MSTALTGCRYCRARHYQCTTPLLCGPVRSWGSGCTAGQQLSASSSKQYVRCLPLAERAAGIASAQVHAATLLPPRVAINLPVVVHPQVDVYLKNLLSYGAVLGAFLDTGIVAPAPGLATDGPDSSPITGRRSASAVNGVATGGLSLRLASLVDVPKL